MAFCIKLGSTNSYTPYICSNTKLSFILSHSITVNLDEISLVLFVKRSTFVRSSYKKDRSIISADAFSLVRDNSNSKFNLYWSVKNTFRLSDLGLFPGSLCGILSSIYGYMILRFLDNYGCILSWFQDSFGKVLDIW